MICCSPTTLILLLTEYVLSLRLEINLVKAFYCLNIYNFFRSIAMGSEQCERCTDHNLSASPLLIRCTACNRFYHTDCLSSSFPTSLLGDSFFSLACSSCSSAGTDVLSRGRISWLTATTLALYNLHGNGSDCNDGFFHWRNDICKFVNDNWSEIFGSAVKKKKTWQGSVSSSLSGNAGTLFESGFSQLKEQGWWKLISLEHPHTQMKNFVPKSNQSIPSRKVEIPELSESLIYKRAKRNGVGSLANAIALKQKRDSLSYIPTVKKAKVPDLKRKAITNESEEANHTTQTDYKLLPSNESKMAKQVLVTYQNKQLLTKFTTDDSNSSEETSRSKSSESGLQFTPDLPFETDLIDSPHSSTNNTCLSPKMIFNSYDPFNSDSHDTASIGDNEDFVEDGISESGNAFKDPVKADSNKLSVINLLIGSGDDCNDNLAEIDDSSIDTLTSDVIGNSSQDFLVEMFGSVESVKETECEPKSIHSVFEEIDMPIVNLEIVQEKESRINEVNFKNKDKILNKFDHLVKKEDPEEISPIEKAKNILDRFQISRIRKDDSLVVPGIITNFVQSPYSQKKLKPYIRRDVETIPVKLKILRDLQSRNKDNLFKELQHPIDFCYVQPNHLSAVNKLASLLFWPGIDLTEVLQYPDFSCVVLYKKLCIGFAFLVPDTRWNESYLSYFGVHPDWKNSGIGTFMLYHIIQTNMGKDLTLHVSANNTAVFLYQKFGFKVEEFVKDFYEKYLAEDSKECKHALFLRLSR